MNTDLFLMRNPTRVVVTGPGCVIFPGSEGAGFVHDTEDTALWSALLQRLAFPVNLADLKNSGALPLDLDEAILDRLAGTEDLLTAGNAERLEARRRAVLVSSTSFHLAHRSQACRHLLVGCTGSVVAGLMTQTLLSLAYSGFQNQLDVILTQTATRFLSRDLLEAYGIRTWTDTFERHDDVRVPHVTLAQSADVIAVLPATADSLRRLANGDCSDLLSLCLTASSAPAVMVPAMNGTMWNDRAIQRNVDRIRNDGRYVIEPTFIFGAADFAREAVPMYGGHGNLWAGPGIFMDALAAILSHAEARSALSH